MNRLNFHFTFVLTIFLFCGLRTTRGRDIPSGDGVGNRIVTSLRLKFKVLSQMLAPASPLRLENKEEESSLLSSDIADFIGTLSTSSLTDILRAIMRVRVPVGNNTLSLGTGFVIENNILVTNYHVLQGIGRYRGEQFLTLFNGIRVRGLARSFKVKRIVGADALADIILLELEGYEGPSFKLANISNESEKDFTLIGFPKGKLNIVKLRWIRERNGDYEFVKRRLGNLSGSSGSPILNDKGEVVAVDKAGTAGMASSGIKKEAIEAILHESRTQAIDDKSDFEWFEEQEDRLLRLAKQGNSEAQYKLARNYYDEGKLRKAGYWARKATRQDHVDAEIFLYRKFRRRWAFVTRKKYMGFLFSTARSDKEMVDSLNNIKDIMQYSMIMMHRYHGEKGSLDSQIIAASLYIYQNHVENAAYMLNKSLEQGNIYAKSHLAEMFLSIILSENEFDSLIGKAKTLDIDRLLGDVKSFLESKGDEDRIARLDVLVKFLEGLE